MVEITDVRIYKKDKGNLKAFASVTIDNAYVIHGIKILEGERGLRVYMPSSRNKRGEFRDIFHPISKEAREYLVNAVLEAYRRVP